MPVPLHNAVPHGSVNPAFFLVCLASVLGEVFDWDDKMASGRHVTLKWPERTRQLRKEYKFNILKVSLNLKFARINAREELDKNLRIFL